MDFKILFTFLLCGIGGIICFHDVIYEYHFVDVVMTWANARQFCRDHYDDLATFRSLEEVQRVVRLTTYTWIGLYDDPASWYKVMNSDPNSWRWSVTGTTSTYQNWDSTDPNEYLQADQYCVGMLSGLWFDYVCQVKNHFVCFTGTAQPGSKQFTLVQTLLSWWDALAYCRTHYTDLALIENASENTAVASLVLSKTAWIGLYRQPWRWSDGSTSNFRNWLSGQPNGLTERCASQAGNMFWHDSTCASKYPFICHRALMKRMTTLKIQLHSGADLTDPAVSAQILQLLAKMFESQGYTDIQLKWTSPPEKV